jgi:hypothetical protein
LGVQHGGTPVQSALSTASVHSEAGPLRRLPPCSLPAAVMAMATLDDAPGDDHIDPGQAPCITAHVEEAFAAGTAGWVWPLTALH